MTGAVRPTLETERRLWRAGHRWVAGVDEVGRGAWAGPLSVGVAVVHAGLRTRSLPFWLRDSKSLPEERRELVYGQVANWCADAAVGHATADECDRFGMTLAWRLAAFRALAALEVRPDALVLDGPWDLLRGPRAKAVAVPADDDRSEADPDGAQDAVPVGEPDAADLDALALEQLGAGVLAPPRDPNPPLPAVTLPEVVLPKVGADATCAAVAAASVLAKVVRDRWMREESEHFPAYGFDRNKGYPSTRHQIALRGYGLSAIHRRSWAYVADLPWR